MKRVTYLLLLSLGLLVSTACSNGESKERKDGNDKAKNEKKEDKKKPKKLEEASPVEVVSLTKGDIGSYILLNTTIETEQMIDVYSQASGFVEKIYREEGNRVRKGDVLVSLDARELKISRDKAKLDLDQKLKEFNRLKEAANQDVLSKEEVEAIEYAYKSALYNFQEADLNYQYAFIKAPVSGIVTKRMAKPGQRINVGTQVYSVTNTSERIAVVQVPEREVGVVQPGQSVQIYSESLRDAEGNPMRFKASVKRVSPVIEPSSGTYKVTIALENNPILRPGMFVNAHIQTALRNDAVLVPKSTLVYENERKFVFVVRDSLVRKVDVLPGFEDSFMVETQNDLLKENDQVVILGQEGLKDNTRVKIVNNEADTTKTVASTN